MLSARQARVAYLELHYETLLVDRVGLLEWYCFSQFIVSTQTQQPGQHTLCTLAASTVTCHTLVGGAGKQP